MTVIFMWRVMKIFLHGHHSILVYYSILVYMYNDNIFRGEGDVTFNGFFPMHQHIHC